MCSGFLGDQFPVMVKLSHQNRAIVKTFLIHFVLFFSLTAISCSHDKDTSTVKAKMAIREIYIDIFNSDKSGVYCKKLKEIEYLDSIDAIYFNPHLNMWIDNSNVVVIAARSLKGKIFQYDGYRFKEVTAPPENFNEIAGPFSEGIIINISDDIVQLVAIKK